MRRLLFYFVLLLIFAGCADKPAMEKILLDFESDAELDQLHWACHTLMTITDQHATHGTRCLRMELYPSPYPGLTPMLKENDWSEFRTLCFDIYNPEEREIEITVRIDDQKSWPGYPDRYNKSFRLVKGQNQIEIPLSTLVTGGRQKNLDLKNIYRLLIFLWNPPEKNVLYVDYIRLER